MFLYYFCNDFIPLLRGAPTLVGAGWIDLTPKIQSTSLRLLAEYSSRGEFYFAFAIAPKTTANL